jgi:hypothetical protein
MNRIKSIKKQLLTAAICFMVIFSHITITTTSW